MLNRWSPHPRSIGELGTCAYTAGHCLGAACGGTCYHEDNTGNTTMCTLYTCWMLRTRLPWTLKRRIWIHYGHVCYHCYKFIWTNLSSHKKENVDIHFIYLDCSSGWVWEGHKRLFSLNLFPACDEIRGAAGLRRGARRGLNQLELMVVAATLRSQGENIDSVLNCPNK